MNHQDIFMFIIEYDIKNIYKYYTIYRNPFIVNYNNKTPLETAQLLASYDKKYETIVNIIKIVENNFLLSKL